jgi:hypothetical protein
MKTVERSMSNSEKPPTQDELRRAVPDIFYAASATASSAYIILVEQTPQLTNLKSQLPYLDGFLHNSFLEVSLLFLRKTTEFFKHRQNGDKNDTLFAYRYFPEWKGVWVVEKGIYDEMHKRVGHITVMQARYGPVAWPIENMTLAAISQWISFFGELRTSWIYDGSPPEEQLRKYQSIFRIVEENCRSAFQLARADLAMC